VCHDLSERNGKGTDKLSGHPTSAARRSAPKLFITGAPNHPLVWHRNSQKRHRIAMPSHRRGTATVEMALITPVLMLLTLGTLDICSMIFLKEAATLAAYEGARSGIEKGKTNQDAIDSITTFLSERKIVHSPNSSIKISKPGFDQAETLQHVTVTVTLPIKGNLLIAPQLIRNLTLKASVSMRKEYRNESS